MECLSGDAQSGSDAARARGRLALAYATPSDRVVRAEREPRCEVLFRGESGDVDTDLGDHRAGGRCIDRGDASQIYAGDADELAAQVEMRLILSATVLGTLGDDGFATRPGLELGHVRFDLRVARGDLLVHEVVALERLPQHEHLFLEEVAAQSFGDLVARVLHSVLAMECKRDGVTLTSHDGAQDRHPRYARDVAEHLVQLHVHDLERLLHPVHVLCARFDERLSVSVQAPERRYLWRSAEDTRQKAVAVQLPQPLAVLHVGLAPRHAADVMGVHELHVEAELVLKQAGDGHPVHARRLHRDGGYPAGLEPPAHLQQVRGRATERTDWLLRRCRVDGYVMLPTSDVDPRRVRVNDAQAVVRPFLSDRRHTTAPRSKGVA